jgi:hypothetical protein
MNVRPCCLANGEIGAAEWDALISASEIDQKNEEKRGKKHHGIATTSIVNLRAAQWCGWRSSQHESRRLAGLHDGSLQRLPSETSSDSSMARDFYIHKDPFLFGPKWNFI